MLGKPCAPDLASFIRIEDWSSPELVGGSEFLLASDLQQDSLMMLLAEQYFVVGSDMSFWSAQEALVKTTVLRKSSISSSRWATKILVLETGTLCGSIQCRAEDSRACAETLFNALPADDDVILCLDHFASLYRKAPWRRQQTDTSGLLHARTFQLVGTLQHWQYIEKNPRRSSHERTLRAA